MINSLVFSKDRAAQLDLLLSSIEKNNGICGETINVLYTCTNEQFSSGYQLVREYHPSVRFMRQSGGIRENILYVLSVQNNHKFICLWTDDTVNYRCETLPLILSSDSLCFTFRLGLNTTVQNCLTGLEQPPLTDYVEKDGVIFWDFTKYHPFSNYGYPFTLDGCIYRTQDFTDWCTKIEFKTLRDLESCLVTSHRDLLKQTRMSAFAQSTAVCIPNNCCQDPPMESGQKYPARLSDLNARFLAGRRLSLDKMDFSNIVGAHQEIEYRWE